MAVSKKQKEDILSTLVDRFGRSKSVVFVANRGLSVAEVTELRRNLGESGVDFQVAKKTLLLKACEDSGVEGMTKDVLNGPVGAAFSYEDEILNAKLLAKFAKVHKNLVLIVAIMDGRVIGQDEVIALAALPAREELLAKFMGSLQSPLSGFVGVSNGLIGGLLMALNGLKEKLESQAPAVQQEKAEAKEVSIEAPVVAITEEQSDDEEKGAETAGENSKDESEEDTGERGETSTPVEETPAEENTSEAEEESDEKSSEEGKEGA